MIDDLWKVVLPVAEMDDEKRDVIERQLGLRLLGLRATGSSTVGHCFIEDGAEGSVLIRVTLDQHAASPNHRYAVLCSVIGTPSWSEVTVDMASRLHQNARTLAASLSGAPASSTPAQRSSSRAPVSPADRDISPVNSGNRWAVLALIAVAQLMVVLDATIVNIALPSAQRDLGFSTGSRQWVVTAYALAFGSLLLVGGKIGDLFGRKWTFIGGLIGFSVVSFIGGLAPSFGVLVAARALQGVFGALLAPSALSLLTVTFADSPDRPKAFGVFAAVATAGASIGLLLGGALTNALSWRWCLYVNLLIAIPTAVAALRLIANEARPQRPRIDWAGVVLACTGLFALVYGFSSAERDSWESSTTIASLVAGVVVLAAFIVTQRRVTSPLLPLHIVWDRARGGAYLSIVIAASSMFAVFLFLTYFMQENLGYSPLKTGVGFLPMTLMIFLVAPNIQTRVLPRIGVRPIVMTGMALGLLSMLLFFTRLDLSSTYAGSLLPGLVLIGIGMPCVFAPAFATATLGVARTDAGVASAMVNTSQQIGGAIGTAVLSTIFAHATADYVASHDRRTPGLAADAAVHGYTAAFTFAAALFAVGVVVAALILPRRIHPERQVAAEAATAAVLTHGPVGVSVGPILARVPSARLRKSLRPRHGQFPPPANRGTPAAQRFQRF